MVRDLLSRIDLLTRIMVKKSTMDFMLTDLILFGSKAAIFALSFILAIVVPVIIIKKTGSKEESKKLKIKNLKSKQDNLVLNFNKFAQDKKTFKKYLKSVKKKDKEKKQNTKATSFVLSFNGDIMATQVDSLREEITLILNVAKDNDEVILLLESGGGSVAHYGLAASQLQRLRDKGMYLTICVDRVAGSGGYLMACVGSQIISAPFAFIGSIGVLANIPNIHDFLKKHDITYEEITAGEYKRTVTPFGKITEEKKERLKGQLSLIHEQFKNFVLKYRSGINLEEVATGEAWLAEQAFKKGLVDKIQASDDYIMEKLKTNNVYKISLAAKKTLLDKLSKKIKSQNILTEKFTKSFLPFFY